MLELKGKYNTAKVFTDNVDNETISQVIELLNQDYIKDAKIRIMPDCHAGTGCVIGTTMTISDKVCPNLVGVDIGCGMLAVRIAEKDVDLPKLDNVINTYVPAGFNVNDEPLGNFSHLNDLVAPANISLAYCSIGRLGGGNHFIELDKDDDGNLWLVIHTGSRHLGLEVAKYYQELAYKQLKDLDVGDKIKAVSADLKAKGREKEIEKTINALKMHEPHIPKSLCYVSGQAFKDYIHDMEIVQKHAELNRKYIADAIIEKMGWHICEEFQTIHNYIDTKNLILRKGSVSARDGEKLIIPINMRDGSLICVGKGNPDWNYSAPHGAGRILSRSEAKDAVGIDEFRESMKGIYSSSVMESTIDESPMVYKPMEEIMENIKDTVDIVKVIKPVYNFKAH